MGGRRAVRQGFLEETVCDLPLEEGSTGRVSWRLESRKAGFVQKTWASQLWAGDRGREMQGKGMGGKCPGPGGSPEEGVRGRHERRLCQVCLQIWSTWNGLAGQLVREIL